MRLPDDSISLHDNLMWLNAGSDPTELLVVVHALGGRLVGSYRPIIARLPRQQSSLAVLACAPGHSMYPLSTVEDMAEYYVELLLEQFPNTRFHICGWSLGGAIAYAMIQVLIARGLRTGALIMLDTWANLPLQVGESYSVDLERENDIIRWTYFMKIVDGSVPESVDLDAPFWSWSEQQRLEESYKYAVDFDPEHYSGELGWSIFRDDYAFFSLLWESGDRFIPPEIDHPVHYIAATEAKPEIVNFWRTRTKNFHLSTCPGDHNSIMGIAYGKRNSRTVLQAMSTA